MASLLCRCGEGMYTSEDPSPFIVNVFYADEIDRAIAEDPDIALHNFLSGWDERNNCDRDYMNRPEPVDYWYCPHCKRVYEVQYVPGGRWLRIFQPSEANPPKNLDGWKQIHVMPDTEVYDATEKNWDIRLSEYIRQHDSIRYYLSPDEKTVHAVEQTTSQIRLTYVLEDSWQQSDTN